jgi:hypothetical protein
MAAVGQGCFPGPARASLVCAILARARAGAGRAGAKALNSAVASRPSPTFTVCVLALFACSPATGGLGEAGAGDDADDADTAASEGGGSEEGDAGGSSEDTGDAPGDGDPSTDTDDPTDPSDTDANDDDAATCGDGVHDPDEQCDGSELGSSSCEELGFVGGELGCAPDCTFDTAGCLTQICGNDVVEGSEACDGDDLDGFGCVDFGLDPGELSCDGSCEFDTQACPIPGVGDSCSLFPGCPHELLYCFNDACYDGSEGDPCNLWDTCKPGLTCKFVGLTPTTQCLP